MLNGGLRWNKHEAIDLISSIMRARTHKILTKNDLFYIRLDCEKKKQQHENQKH